MSKVVARYDGVDEKGLHFFCPACGTVHGIRLTPNGWGWNDSMDKPTFTPSVLVRGTKKLSDDEYARLMAGEKIYPRPLLCHSFVRDGRIEFLGDCLHELAGQTVDLPPWPHGDDY
jgi:Family of unknown function (DUF6527)